MRESCVLRYDPKNDPWKALNDARVLDDTPIGTLRVITWGHAASVAVMHDTDRTRVQRVIYTLKRGENPLNAIYGKRTFEQAHVRALYDARDEVVAASEEREADDLSGDFVRALTKLRNRRDDGDEAIAGAMGASVRMEDGSFMSFRTVKLPVGGEDG